MIMKKAPKDMNAVEFVDCLINGNVLTSVPDDDSFIQLKIIKDMLTKPAPNPFTPDQLAWMRELQREGFNYASKDPCGDVFMWSNKPHKFDVYRGWTASGGGKLRIITLGFLTKVVSHDDTEPLCFADYAPLEE